MSESLPANVRAVRDAYVAQFPVPSGGPNPADEAFENRCRAWVRGLAEQVRFSLNDAAWGCKNAGGGRPQSKDALAHQVGPTLYGYDLLFGVGTGSPSLVPSPSGEDITGQTFMAVQPVDHLGGSQPAPGPDPQPPNTDYEDLKRRVEALEATALKHGDDIHLHTQSWNGKPGKFVAAELGDANAPLRGNREKASTFETFTVTRKA